MEDVKHLESDRILNSIDILGIEKQLGRSLTNEEKHKIVISYLKNNGAIDIDEVYN
jgi:hypothetical protein